MCPSLGEASAPISCFQLSTPLSMVTRQRWGLAAPVGDVGDPSTLLLRELLVCWVSRPNFTPVFRDPWYSVSSYIEGSAVGIT